MSGLVVSQEVAGTANFEIAHRDLESGAEFVVLTDRSQALVGLLGQHSVPRMEQVGVRALTCSTDAPPQLVELAEAEHVRPVDDEGVDRRHVDTGFDDGGADQHVVVALGEVDHDLFKTCLVHLAVRDRDPRLWHEIP